MEWFYSHVLGIKLEPNKEICISPSLSKELSFVKGEYKTKEGVIRVEWRCSDSKYYVKVKADKNVSYCYNFAGKEIITIKKKKNDLRAVLK